jgi:hypothetical protein
MASTSANVPTSPRRKNVNRSQTAMTAESVDIQDYFVLHSVF